MKYRKNYLQSYNIDWFYRFGSQWIHCSSQGGLLPEKVDDAHLLPQLQALMNIIPIYSDFEEVEVNEAFIKQRYERHTEIIRSILENSETDERNLMIPQQEYEIFKADYIESFVEMAQKGFHSYVRFNIDDFTDNATVLVAKPTKEASDSLSKDFNSLIDSINGDKIAESSVILRNYIESISMPDIKLDFDTELLNLY